MLLAVDKPRGISSFDIIRALRRDLCEKKIGHSGTLDPMATGLLLLGTGQDTKKIGQFIGLEKTYETTIDFSKKSDTRDLSYRDYFENIDTTGQDIDITKIKEKLNCLIPEYNLPLTPFSAKKKEGKKMYELARKGQDFNETRLMKTYGYEILEYNFPSLKLKLHVGSGTYIRSIGHRLGEEFNLGGILTDLRRLKIGEYNLQNIDLNRTSTFFKKDGNNTNFKYGIIE